MATNKPCRFKNSELNKLIKCIPITERHLLVKLKHYIETPIDLLCKEDKKQRTAAAVKREKKKYLISK